MARALTTQDAYAMINSLVRQATGQSAIAATDLSSFISTGETVMSAGKENILNALSLIVGRTLVASRSYRAKLAMLNSINTGVYSHRLRKISYYAADALPSGMFNTNLNTNLAEGYTASDNSGNSTKSMWEQHRKKVFEADFAGSEVWQYCQTRDIDTLEQAFNSPESFNAFISGYITECANDIESEIEAFNRATLISEIAKRYYLTNTANYISQGAINLTSAYNTKFGTSYTSQQLRTTYLKSFLEFLVATVKEISDRMTERGTAYHDPYTVTDSGVTYSILRHTPYDRQRVMLYGPLLRDAEAMVLPEIFRPEYLDINRQFEKVEFWQSNNSDSARPKIKVNSAFTNHSNGIQSTTGNVTLDYVVGCIYDVDALMTDFQLERTNTSPLEARKSYYNTWYTFAKNAIGDQTENFVVLYMADPVGKSEETKSKKTAE